jgi:hypothetical protein
VLSSGENVLLLLPDFSDDGVDKIFILFKRDASRPLLTYRPPTAPP